MYPMWPTLQTLKAGEQFSIANQDVLAQYSDLTCPKKLFLGKNTEESQSPMFPGSRPKPFQTLGLI